MKRIFEYLRRFTRRDDGNATVEFVILFPIMISIFGSAFEASLISQRQALMAGALDRTVRELQLGQLGNPSHGELKAILCNRAGFIPDCMDAMHIELEIIDKANWAYRGGQVQCIDREDDSEPDINFNHGGTNQFMLITACAAIRPMVPLTGLGMKLPKINNGQDYGLVAFSAYVVEPQ